MKPVNVKSSRYTNFDKKNIQEDSKFKVSNQGKISKYKNVFAKAYTPN